MNSSNKRNDVRNEAFQSIVEAISRTMNLPVSIWIPDEDRKALRINAAVGLSKQYIEDARLKLSETSVTGEAFVTGEIITVYDVLSDSRWKYTEAAQEMGWKSVICVPIKVHGKVIGVISVYTFMKREFSEDAKRLLENYATQIELTESMRRHVIFGENLELLITGEQKTVLDEIVSKACQFTNADAAVVYPFDPIREQFFDIDSVGVYGLRQSLKLKEKPRMDKGMAAYIIREQEVILSDIEKEDPEMLKTSPFIQREGIRAFMGVSLVVRGQTLGVLYVDYRDPHIFTDDEKNTIRLLAHQAAIAINNARLFEQANIRTNVLKSLYDVGSDLVLLSGEEEDLEKVLLRIAESAKEILEADLIDLYQYKQSRDEFVVPPIQVGDLYKPAIIKNDILEDDILYEIIVLDEPKYTTNVLDDEVLTQPFSIDRVDQPTDRYVVREKVEASAAIPLIAGKEKVGVMFANFRTPQSFSQQQKELIELFANQAAIAIHNSKLFKVSQQRSERLDLVREVAAVVSSARDLDDILQLAVGGLARVFDVKQSAVAIFDEAGEYSEVRAEYLEKGCVSAMGDRIPLKGNPQIEKMRKTKRPLIVKDVQTDSDMEPIRELMEKRKTLSMMIVPIFIGDEIVGTIGIDAIEEKRDFTAEDANIAQAIADQTASAIRSSQLLKDVTSRADALQSLHEVGPDLMSVSGSSEDLKNILERIAKSAKKVLKADLIDLYQYFQDKDEFLIPVQVGERYDTKVVKKKIYKDDVVYSILAQAGIEPAYNHDAQGKEELTKRYEKRKDAPGERFVIREDIKSSAAIPLVVQKEVVGLLFANFREPQAFLTQQQELIELFANQAAIAIRNARQLENRLDDIRALRDITEQMHRGKFDEVLDSIADRAVEMTGAKYGGVWLLNKAGSALEFGGLAGHAHLEETPRTIPITDNGEKSISKRVVQEARAYLCPDVSKDSNYMEWYKDTRSQLTVPLIYGDRAIGTINVESIRKNWFTDNHRRLLEAMASQVAMVVQMRGRLDALVRVGIELTSDIHKEKNEILKLIFEQAQKLTDTKDMYIALYDESSGEIRFPLATKDGKPTKIDSRKADMKERGMTEDIIFTREPILHRTLEDANKWYQQPGHKEFLGDVAKSWLGVPMIAGDRVLGVIAIYDWKEEYAYDGQDLSVFSSMASQATIALDNATLYYDVIQKLEALNKIGIELTSDIHKEKNEILKLIFEQAQKLTDTKDMYIALYDESSGEIRFPLATKDGKPTKIDSRKADMKERGMTEDIIFTREPILHRTLEDANKWYQQPGHKEFLGDVAKSWLGVPMIAGDRVLGVIAIYDWKEEYAYDGQDLSVFSSMASQATIALDNARLYEEARGEVIAAKQLSTLGTAIAALQHRINNTFNIIIPNVTRLRSRVDLNDPTVVEILEIIERNARYTSTIIARIQEPLKEVEVTDVNINAILDAVVLKNREVWKASVTRPIVGVEFAADENIPIIRGPSGQIAEVFDNLLGNAYKAMPKGGEIRVESELNNGIIYIKVIDSGLGIPEEKQERLFKKPVPSREPGAGAGLGLWLSHLMLQSIGGNIQIESSSKKGTTMLVTIPVDQVEKEVAQ